MGYLPFLATRLMVLVILLCVCLFMRQINVLFSLSQRFRGHDLELLGSRDVIRE